MSWSLCVQAYHTDLMARAVSGKSPAMEEARKEGRRQAQVAALAEELRLQSAGPDEVRSAAVAQIHASERMKLAALAAAGFHVTTEVEPALRDLDLFAEFKRRKSVGGTYRASAPPKG